MRNYGVFRKEKTEEPSNSVSTQLLSANSGGEHCNLAQKWKKNT